MIKDQLKAALDRVSTWPAERQQELAELVLQIEAEMSDGSYRASSDELAAIDQALAGDLASEEEIAAAFDAFRRG
jgi:methylaspartate ammonia-lyase